MILYKLQPQPWLSKFPLLIVFIIIYHIRGLPGGSEDKESACNAGDSGYISGSGRSSAEGNGYPTDSFIYSFFFLQEQGYLSVLVTDLLSVPGKVPCISWNIRELFLKEWTMNELVGVLSFYRVGEKRYTCNDHMLVMFKILQARLQQYLNRELPDVQAGFRKISK